MTVHQERDGGERILYSGLFFTIGMGWFGQESLFVMKV